MEKKEIDIKQLNKAEHPLIFLYPLAVCLHKLFRKKTLKNDVSKISILMRKLCVRENVEKELYIYSIKKIATVIAVFLGICITGALMLIARKQDEECNVNQISRGEYGSGTKEYSLEVEYDGEKETVVISVDQMKLSREEVLTIFDDSYDDIVAVVLGENKSVDEVSKPLNLITSYNDIKIQWAIDNTESLNYKGEISDTILENEFVPVNLTATFSMGGVSEAYSIQLLLTGKSLNSRELLIENIQNAITTNNSEYSENVTLPDSINGKTVTFRQPSEDNIAIILVLGVVAGILIIVGYDKNLEKKVKERNEQMLLDFTEIVFKLSLLYEAGISIFRAWEKIVTEYMKNDRKIQRYAYMEMQLTLEKIKSGVSEAEAYGQFGKRCGLHQYIKLGNILEQNLSKGTKGMKELLKQEAQDAFEERKRLARKKGEEASTKMLIPMVMMLIVVIIIVAVPALMSIDF